MAGTALSDRTEGNSCCFHCGKIGHFKSQCNLLKKEIPSFLIKKAPTRDSVKETPIVEKNCPEVIPKEKQCLFVILDTVSDEYLESITIDENCIKCWRDTGSEVCIIRPEMVPKKYQHPTSQVNLKGLGQVIPSNIVSLSIEYNKLTGVWDFSVSSDIPYKCLIGNDLAREVKRMQGITNETEYLTKGPYKKQEITCLPIYQDLGKQPEASSGIADLVKKMEGEREILKEQKADDTLQTLFDIAQNIKDDLTLEKPTRFIIKDGVLYREILNQKFPGTPASYTQIVIPQKYREQLMQIAHDSPHGGHLGIRRTTQRITKNFFWPGMYQQIKEFCQSCDTCQRISSGRDRTKAPLIPMPIIGEPFFRVGIDIIGPLPKPSRRGCKYILTMIDYATRSPGAVALSNTETTTIANALLSIWGRTGYPKELISDLGTQFTSRLMEKLLELCGIKHLTSSAYHPQTNRLVENLNKTLVRMIKSYSQQHPNDWDIKLQQLLFAYREVPLDSTGYSPFELLYGRQVRGPLNLVRGFWEAYPEGNLFR
uniref:Gypsy retrotransposon integrase-like protein 1 n=1 Tax=Anolis carolinensis TaxID=28377 RepID=A0A803STS9_ANOCA